jgi:hypothetical protein
MRRDHDANASGSYEAATLLWRFRYVFTAVSQVYFVFVFVFVFAGFRSGDEFRHVQVDFLNPNVCVLHAMDCLRLACVLWLLGS